MTDRELMQQALDAMLNNPDDISDEMFESVKALKARLAQPDQAPRQWQGLTDDEIEEAGHLRMLPYSFARAIEAKLREKNA